MTANRPNQVDRRQFLRGDIHGHRPSLRPPWSLAEAAFIEACERCGDCVQACGEGILKTGGGGFPEVDFSRGGCTFCGDCLVACKHHALTGDIRDTASAWSLRAQIGPDCLARKGVICRSCGERCDTRAIRFQLKAGGAARPELDVSLCNGCGECYGVCPTQAVRIVHAELLRDAV
jgi:ferredoxin-type protein NapF